VTTNDNWGWRARIGMFIVGNEAVPEAEWWAMAPPGVSVHAARVTARAPWARWREDRKGVEPEEDLLRGCRQFAAMRLSAVVVASSDSAQSDVLRPVVVSFEYRVSGYHRGHTRHQRPRSIRLGPLPQSGYEASRIAFIDFNTRIVGS